MAGTHLQAIYDRIRIGGAEDVAVTTHDLHHDGAGNMEPLEELEAIDAFTDFWFALNTRIADDIRLREVRLYRGYNGDGSPGEVDLIVPSLQAGGSTSAMLPPQIACTVTEIVTHRRGWGRFYLPGLASSQLATDGTLTAAAVAAIADAAKAMYDRWHAIPDVVPVVWGIEQPGATDIARPVIQVRVDNVLDVIRRRRYETVTDRQTRSTS